MGDSRAEQTVRPVLQAVQEVWERRNQLREISLFYALLQS